MVDHCDSTTLALIALGEPGSPDSLRHIDDCPSCSEELASLERAVGAARSAGGPQGLVSPPEPVWAAVSAELGLDTPSGTDSSVATQGVGGRVDAAPSGGAQVTEIASRRRPRGRWLALAAAVVAGAVVGGAVVAGVVNQRVNDAPVLASTGLAPVPGGPAGSQTGRAAVEQGTNGTVLALDTSELAQPDGFYEVWLMDTTTGGLVAMGTVPDGQSSVKLPIPAGLDLGRFSTVDISVEPLDGDPKHSAVSVLRGDLTA